MKRTIEKIVEYAASVADPEKIILFGSMAQDRINVYSDVDLLIVSENPEIKREVTAKINSFSNQLSLKIDVLIHSQSELEQACQKPHSFLAAIVNSGSVVFEKATCVSEEI